MCSRSVLSRGRVKEDGRMHFGKIDGLDIATFEMWGI